MSSQVELELLSALYSASRSIRERATIATDLHPKRLDRIAVRRMALGSWLRWPSGNTSARIAAIDSDTHSKTKTEAVRWSGNGSLAVAEKGLGGRHFEKRRVLDGTGRSEKTAFARPT